MTWNNAERTYFFGPESAHDGVTEPFRSGESNVAFLEHYCSEGTRSLIEKDGVSAEVARCVINRIVEIVPGADHVSPGWSVAPLPLIVVAVAHLQMRRQRMTLVCRSPRFGLCLHEGHIYIWAEKKDIQDFGGFSPNAVSPGPWVPWRGTDLLRYFEPVDCNCSIKLDPNHPLSHGHPLVNFLKHMEEKLREAKNSPARQRLKGALEPFRTELDEPEGFDVIYPKLADESGDAGDVDEPSPEAPKLGPKPSKPKVPRGGGSSNNPARQPEPGLAIASSAESMLQVLREVAIARVRTAIPEFGNGDLDKWIMSTGYAGAKAPHRDLSDLFCVYAASLANSGGIKPQPNNFGVVIREGIRPFLETTRIGRVPTLQELAEKCQQHLVTYPLGGDFANDINRLAAEVEARPLMAGLLGSVSRFAEWLQAGYDGNASNFHASLAQPPGARPGQHVFPILRKLDQLPWMGVATAANFVKDAQIPGLTGLDPRTVANTIAGWFAKPDLHVARLMAYITGRYTLGNPQQLRLPEALALFYGAPAQNFQGCYENLIPQDGPDMRVIADIHEWAQHVRTSALEIDRVLYLIGVQRTIVDGHPIDTPCYGTFVREVDAAVNRGVPRKS